MQGITLIPINDADLEIPGFLALTLYEMFHVPCDVRPVTLSLKPYLNTSRRQYHSTKILTELLPFAKGNKNHFLAIVDVDLYIPILTFVFGEAQLGNQCALISVYRLRQEFYGLPANNTLFLQRCEKEAVHELGHTLGLTHCHNFECVMHYGHAIEDIDAKRNIFCPGCAAILGIRTHW
jgi:archaemetzincin